MVRPHWPLAPQTLGPAFKCEVVDGRASPQVTASSCSAAEGVKQITCVKAARGPGASEHSGRELCHCCYDTRSPEQSLSPTTWFASQFHQRCVSEPLGSASLHLWAEVMVEAASHGRHEETVWPHTRHTSLWGKGPHHWEPLLPQSMHIQHHFP